MQNTATQAKNNFLMLKYLKNFFQTFAARKIMQLKIFFVVYSYSSIIQSYDFKTNWSYDTIRLKILSTSEVLIFNKK